MVILSPAEEQANWSFGAKVSKWGLNVEHPDSYREGISGASVGHDFAHITIDNQQFTILMPHFIFCWENGALMREEF